MNPFIVENEIKYRRMELEQSRKHCYIESQFDTEEKEKSKPRLHWNIIAVFSSIFRKNSI